MEAENQNEIEPLFKETSVTSKSRDRSASTCVVMMKLMSIASELTSQGHTIIFGQLRSYKLRLEFEDSCHHVAIAQLMAQVLYHRPEAAIVMKVSVWT